MTTDKFNQQFTDSPYELIVRISWCWTKKSGSFPQVGEMFHAKARFDRAIDLRTDEVIGQGKYNWLEWLTPKYHIGHPYGFAFRSGHLYRILVREAPSDGKDMCRRYLVEEVSKYDVEDSRLDPYQEFSSLYDNEETEHYLLIEDSAFGWGNVFDYRRASVRYVAIAENTRDQPIACLGRLSWMEKARGDGLKTKFDKMGVYQVVVRCGKDNPNTLMLVRVIKKIRNDTRFDAIRDEYMKPIILKSPLGTFELKRRYDWYEGNIDYLGNECNVLLQVEAGTTDVSIALARLEELHDDLAAVDRNVRSYAADELLENACDWCDEELTREQFMSRMTDPSIIIDTNGFVELMFDDGGMFWGHVIVVDLDAKGNLIQANIEG